MNILYIYAYTYIHTYIHAHRHMHVCTRFGPRPLPSPACPRPPRLRDISGSWKIWFFCLFVDWFYVSFFLSCASGPIALADILLLNPSLPARFHSAFTTSSSMRHWRLSSWEMPATKEWSSHCWPSAPGTGSNHFEEARKQVQAFTCFLNFSISASASCFGLRCSLLVLNISACQVAERHLTSAANHGTNAGNKVAGVRLLVSPESCTNDFCERRHSGLINRASMSYTSSWRNFRSKWKPATPIHKHGSSSEVFHVLVQAVDAPASPPWETHGILKAVHTSYHKLSQSSLNKKQTPQNVLISRALLRKPIVSSHSFQQFKAAFGAFCTDCSGTLFTSQELSVFGLLFDDVC